MIRDASVNFEKTVLHLKQISSTASFEVKEKEVGAGHKGGQKQRSNSNKDEYSNSSTSSSSDSELSDESSSDDDDESEDKSFEDAHTRNDAMLSSSLGSGKCFPRFFE